jgi:hypothetical protein
MTQSHSHNELHGDAMSVIALTLGVSAFAGTTKWFAANTP